MPYRFMRISGLAGHRNARSMGQVAALLGWLVYMLMTPLQLSANTRTMLMAGETGVMGAMQDAPMPMGHLSVDACMQLQCHAVPAVAPQGTQQSLSHQGHEPALVVSELSPYPSVVAPTSGSAAQPPLRAAPILSLRPARLLI